MLTRAKVRHALTWAGVALGPAALLGYLFCLFGSLTVHAGRYMLALDEGSLIYAWRILPMPPTPGNPTPVPIANGVSLRTGGGEWSWLPRWAPPDGSRTYPPLPGRLTIPLWIPLAIGLVSAYRLLPPGPARGHCRKCNYDLRGIPTPAEGPLKCPECGTLAS